jgi:hypothetical protein
VLVKGHSGKLAGGSFTIAAGATRTLKLSFLPAGIALLHSDHGQLTATLTVMVRARGSFDHTTTAHVTIRG